MDRDDEMAARLDVALATIEAEREARLQLEARTARLEADLCAQRTPAMPRRPRPLLGREFWARRRRRCATGAPRKNGRSAPKPG
eukprot:COSAG04_NODE_4680_length_1951_cov_2.253240_2_plen_84_part_00